MHKAQEDAAAARVLACAADKDVAEFKQILNGHTGVLNALRETQVEQGQQIGTLQRDMQDGFTKMSLGMVQIGAQLQILLDKQ